MAVRVTANSAVFAGLFSMLSLLRLFANLRYVPIHLALTATLLGVMVGAASGFAVAKRQLKFLTENGETRVPLSTILFLVGGMFILLSFGVFYAFTAPIGALATVLDFAYPTLPAYSAAGTILFLRWERKHRKLILAGTWSNRLYVSPMSD